MSIVTVAQFKAYAKKLDGDVTVEALYQTYIDAAEDLVSTYLGYAPSTASYTHTFYGDARAYLNLRAKPITALTSVTIDGVSSSTSLYSTDGETLTRNDGTPFNIGSLIVVAYTAGYSTVPAAIVNCILQIASLKGMEAGENIGVTSQSFDGGNSRNFINYTNFDKYLASLDKYRILKLGRLEP